MLPRLKVSAQHVKSKSCFFHRQQVGREWEQLSMSGRTRSEQNISPPRIVAADHRATQRVPGQWRLEIMWRFENETDTPLYVLLDQPLMTTIGDPLILNHAAAEPSLPVEPNREADFEIITVSARDAHERRLQYHLALPEALEVVTVIGRFGYSHTPPDPA